MMKCRPCIEDEKKRLERSITPEQEQMIYERLEAIRVDAVTVADDMIESKKYEAPRPKVMTVSEAQQYVLQHEDELDVAQTARILYQAEADEAQAAPKNPALDRKLDELASRSHREIDTLTGGPPKKARPNDSGPAISQRKGAG